ncbi:hypothetical protein FB2170_17146 [Maribacter sp. HTCC2170]|nr:hypothetical protein FB2170_17146 [Maribacter sp. HTCC2170]
MPFLCNQFINNTETVIKKGGGTRPNETLATLYFKVGATFYYAYGVKDNREKEGLSFIQS